MYLLEGRGKGATWTLLLETLHNEGVYITAGNQQKKFAIDILDDMLIEGVISEHGKEYLKRHILHINEIRSRGHWRKKKFYVDSGLEILERYIAQETAHRPEIIALGNDDEQIVHPRFFKDSEIEKIEK